MDLQKDIQGRLFGILPVAEKAEAGAADLVPIGFHKLAECFCIALPQLAQASFVHLASI
jgi:hypothetical protein